MIIVFDLETTGTDVSKDRIVQLAAVKVSDDFTKHDELKTILINPGVPIPKEASDVHGITDEMVADKPTFAQYAKKLHEYFQGCDIAGFNSIRFDVQLLMAEFERAGITLDLSNTNLIDAYTIFIMKEQRNLSAAVKFYCGREMEGAHDAGNDVMATLDVLKAQLSHYPDLASMSLNELHNFCGGDKRIDLSGYLVYDENRDVVFNFGKHKGAKVVDQISYAQWMIGSDFPRDTKRVLIELIKTQ